MSLVGVPGSRPLQIIARGLAAAHEDTLYPRLDPMAASHIHSWRSARIRVARARVRRRRHSPRCWTYSRDGSARDSASEESEQP
jgi:hypothetical protein